MWIRTKQLRARGVLVLVAAGILGGLVAGVWSASPSLEAAKTPPHLINVTVSAPQVLLRGFGCLFSITAEWEGVHGPGRLYVPFLDPIHPTNSGKSFKANVGTATTVLATGAGVFEGSFTLRVEHKNGRQVHIEADILLDPPAVCPTPAA